MHYAIVNGTGRSGTNWTLDMLDASPQTHCRNEPHTIAGTDLSQFPRVWNSDLGGSPEIYREHWDDIAQDVVRRCGERDHPFRHPKAYLHPWSNLGGLSRVATNRRVRRHVARVQPSLRGGEWELPRWLGSRRRLRTATGVIKLLMDAPLFAWLLAERPDVPIVHVIRHPGGRMNSWLNRLVSGMDDQARSYLLADRRCRIARIRRHEPEWANLIPEPETLALVRLELWFWRYANESTVRAGQGHERFLMVRFDELAREPLSRAERLYRHLGLAWTDEVRDRVAADTTTSVFGPVADPRTKVDAWRTTLDPAHADAVDEIVGGSPLSELLA